MSTDDEAASATFTTEDVNRIVGERLARERKGRERDVLLTRIEKAEMELDAKNEALSIAQQALARIGELGHEPATDIALPALGEIARSAQPWQRREG